MGRFKDEGNILVSNQSNNVLVNYNFMLRVEGIYDLPCKAVHSFTKENEFEYVQEGGLNDYVHMLRKPVSKPFSFTVERYVGMDIIPPLPLGAELILPVILMVAPNANQFGNSKRTFVFTGCTVMSKTYGELNAEKSDLLTETIVIGYREMVEVTIPVHIGSDGKLWEFDGQNVNGNGARSATTLPENGSPKVRKWPTVQSAKFMKKEEPKTEKEAETGKEAAKPPRVKSGPDTGKAVVRKWPTVQSAKTYDDIFKKQEELETEEEAETGKEAAKPATTAKPPRVKPGPNTGKAVVRKWPTVRSAKTYDDIFKKQEELETEEEAETGKEAAKPPRVKPGPDTGKAVVRKWPTVRSAKTKPGSDTKKAVVRKWPPTQSAKTYDDIFKTQEELKTETGKEAATSVTPARPSQVKLGPDTGKAVVRKWLSTQSAKRRIQIKSSQNKET